MSEPDPQAVAAYRAAFTRRAVPVMVQRITGVAPNAVTREVEVSAVVTGYSPQPGENYTGPGEITRGLRKAILLVEALAAKDFPLPLRKNDKIVILGGGGEKLNVVDADAETRALGGAIECQVSGVS